MSYGEICPCLQYKVCSTLRQVIVDVMLTNTVVIRKLYSGVTMLVKKHPSPVILYINTHGMSVVQSNYLVSTNSCIILYMVTHSF